MDAAGLPALIEAIRHLHKLEAVWLESVPVHEQHEGRTVWQGEVQVFAVKHPKASRYYLCDFASLTKLVEFTSEFIGLRYS